MEFRTFKNVVQEQFKFMQTQPLYRVQVDKDELWDTYLSSFPAGSNPIFRERTEHDCQCCKQFIRTVGDVVAIIDDELVSIWDVDIAEPYQTVARALSDFVKSRKIENIFLHTETTAGTDKNYQESEDGAVLTWEHFFIQIGSIHRHHPATIGTRLGSIKADFDVFRRSLMSISSDAIDTVLELITQNSLYRGEEHKGLVESFKILHQESKKAADLDIFCWQQVGCRVNPAVLRIRNTAIGTLLTDVSEGMELDRAAASFESKAAPTNYKRTTALVTKTMVAQAKEKIAELGLTSALERRYAVLEDININDILFADRSVRSRMADVFDEVTTAVKDSDKSYAKVEEVHIDRFIQDILPLADSVEILVENRHTNNLVSLIAPADPEARSMFKWPNKFSWSYTGELTDSIKERVKKAGGSITGDLMCRLAWYNKDDLDLHMIEPDGHRIYYPNIRQRSLCGGVLDVDANGGDGVRDDPVENIVYSDKCRMLEGTYTLLVNQYAARQTTNPGFAVEVEYQGEVHTFVYEKAVRQGMSIEVARISFSKKSGFSITPSLPSTQAQKEVWGVTTQAFQKVSVVMNSPNHWDGHAVGNKHFFFMLEGCVNGDKARGFFNEFLVDDLTPHRKVLEIVGSKMRTEEASDQLSGLGFSSTQRNSAVCRVKGSFSRTIKIVF